jgi:hypothetical protein
LISFYDRITIIATWAEGEEDKDAAANVSVTPAQKGRTEPQLQLAASDYSWPYQATDATYKPPFHHIASPHKKITTAGANVWQKRLNNPLKERIQTSLRQKKGT